LEIEGYPRKSRFLVLESRGFLLFVLVFFCFKSLLDRDDGFFISEFKEESQVDQENEELFEIEASVRDLAQLIFV